MFEENMLVVGIVILIFGLLAYDLSSNNGEWFGIVSGFANDVLSELQHFLR